MRTELKSENPNTEAPPVEAAAPVDERKEPIGLKYRGDGSQSFTGVRKRDLTVSELLELDPATVNNATAKHPVTGKAIHELTAAGEKAWSARWAEKGEG